MSISAHLRRAGAMPAHPPSTTGAGNTERAQRISPNDPNRRVQLVAALLAQVPSGDRVAASTAIPAILDAARASGNSDPNQIAYMLATAQTESDFGAHMIETGHSQHWFNRVYGCEDGNRPGSQDGFAFRGRGYVQTTHLGRYAEMSHHLGLPDVSVIEGGKPRTIPALVAHPDALVDPKLAARALVIGIEHNLFTHNPAASLEKTVPVGRKPGDADFYHARAIVNGIVRAQAESISAHASAYAQILHAYRHSGLGAPGAR